VSPTWRLDYLRFNTDLVSEVWYTDIASGRKGRWGGGRTSVLTCLGSTWPHPIPQPAVVAAAMRLMGLVADRIFDDSREPLGVMVPRDEVGNTYWGPVEVDLLGDGSAPVVVAIEGRCWPKPDPVGVYKSFVAAQFSYLAAHVDAGTYADLAVRRCGVDPSALVLKLLSARDLTVQDITRKYMALVTEWGACADPAHPLGPDILDAVFEARRVSASPEPAYYDAILDDLASRGLVLDADAPGDRIVCAVLTSMDAAFLAWFLTRYPGVNLMDARGDSTGYYLVSNNAVPTRTEVEGMLAVLRKHGYDEIADDGAALWKGFCAQRGHLVRP